MPITTRKRTNPPPALSYNPNSTNPEHLPPRPRKKPLRKVFPPLKNFGLDNLIYIVAPLSALLVAYYSYRTVQYKRQVSG